MTDSERPAPFLIAEDAALDFLNSVCAPWGRKIEWLGNNQDLLSWQQDAGLVSREAAEQVKGLVPLGEHDDVAKKARNLREWLRGFVAQYAGRPLNAVKEAHVKKINDILKSGRGYAQIDTSSDGGSSLKLANHRHWQEPEDILVPVAEAIGNLVCNEDFARIKQCQGPTCTLWFLDVSKNQRRKWCTMAVCGNRAKATTHRNKKSSQS